jgi:hypothetical protein
MRVYTNVKVLKKAWNLLKELKLEGLLSGGEVKVDLVSLADSLLVSGKLNEFCQIITKSDVDFEEMELEDVIGVISDFFTATGKAFKRLNLQAALQKTA